MSCYLVELPAELRTQIFEYLFQNARITFTNLNFNERRSTQWFVMQHNTNISILATCKSLRREAYPIFWNTLEMFIPSSMLYDLRETGLWSHPSLHRMISLRQQIWNISIGARLYGDPSQDSIMTLAMITCFVTDLKHYSNLKRLTLVALDSGSTLREACPSLTIESEYECLSDIDRREVWKHLKSKNRVFIDRQFHQKYQCWSDFWTPVYNLILSWRSDPIKSNIFDYTTCNPLGTSKSQPNSAMTFKIYHQNYEQLCYSPKCLGDPPQYEAINTTRNYAVMPPLIYEAEVNVLQSGNDHGIELQNVRLIGEHRSFWQQSDPPEQLKNIKELPSLLMSYPFWILGE